MALLSADHGGMPDVARRPRTDLKPLDPGLNPEVLDWVNGLRAIWAAAGLSMNRFALLYPIDKGTVSRYLNGLRVPGDHWFLDTLLGIQAANGQPVTDAVRQHLTNLQLSALQTAHPHEYRVRLVRDQLEIAQTCQQEAECFARSLEEQLAARKRQIQELTDENGRVRAGWNADRVAMQAEYERLAGDIDEMSRQLYLARNRAVHAE